MSGLQLVQPITMTDAMLLSSNVPETDYAAWNAGTAYSIGNRVIRTTTHRIYERVVAGTTATAPESDATNWLDVSATNRWKCFDQINTTSTVQAGSITFSLKPGQTVNTVALLNVVATTVRVQMTDPVDGTVYDKTTTLQAPPAGADWYSYYFGPIKSANQVLALNLPSYYNATFNITITAASGNASVGVILLGYANEIGNGIQYGARLGIVDYSAKTKNAYGDYTITQRAWSKRATFDIRVDNTEIDDLQTLLASVRSTPCLWVGSDQYAATVVYGFYKDFGITIAYPTVSNVSIELEGLT